MDIWKARNLAEKAFLLRGGRRSSARSLATGEPRRALASEGRRRQTTLHLYPALE